MSKRKSADQSQSQSPTQEGVAALPYCSGKAVKAEKGEWLVPDWLPRGVLALLEGDKGCGKSHLAAAFAAYLTAGVPLAGQRPPKPASVIWGAGEESVAVDSKPKLIAAGADLNRVYFLGRDAAGRQANTPTFPADLPGLERMIRDTGAVLTFLDPLRSYLPIGLSPGDEKANGAVAEEMQRVGERTRSVVMCARHLTKSVARDALHAGTGSVAWGAVARSILRAEESATDGFERVFSVLRCNRVKLPSPQAYSIAGNEGESRIVWGPTLGRDIIAQLSAALDEGQRLESTVAEDLIRRELAKGPRHAAEIYAAGEKERISKGAMWRAAKKVGITWDRKGYGSEGFVEWSLPIDSHPPSPSKKRKSKGKSAS